MSQTEVIHAYRNLYRWLLRAVQYSTPARYTARDQLRRAFREPGHGGGQKALDSDGVKRTIWFLQAAAKETGLEHRILKNLLKVAWHRENGSVTTWRELQADMARGKKPSKSHDKANESEYMHYDMTIAMLNKTMGLCLR